ncbi:hypothetical protein CAPTEDRAFT_163557 [Capitella teleta]|uniref:C3H1-type domain-containing protein n=1 Tax=Capitella teleta TaxID=283909 RepID=R7UEL9_CAPTE|nr:hypothetical protein CAPTEDRAFT_163557 [Capitella teleta]|eukprot:ELU02233.1 hypothetical protein CAPTEDRAFT_163557 [Capitella teleta]
MVHQQVMSSGPKSAKQLEKERLEKLGGKDTKKVDELNTLFRPVEQKVAKGTDPKSVLCAFFKAGTCKKGDKCKFSHDINIARKGEKRNMYEETNDDTMDQWDEQKLEEVVNKKHGDSNKSVPKTAIICKFFLDAVESSKYGWFWQCPNGAGCHYRHALPEGFVLKKDKAAAEEKKEEISLEELIERERAALSSNNLTKVTLHSFLKWKDRKRKDRAAKEKAEAKKRKQDFSSGKTGGISGREMFEFNPALVSRDDDDEEGGAVFTERDEDEYIGPVREINMDLLAAEELECMAEEEAKAAKMNGKEDEASKLPIAAGGPDPEATTAEAISAAMSAVADSDSIDENLFDGEDLDLIEDELEELELND